MTFLGLIAIAGAEAPLGVAVGPASGIVVDGVLDEAAWSVAESVSEFSRFQPTIGGAPGGETRVSFVQDERNLYVGVKVRDAGYPIRARVSAREEINSDDQVGIYLDPFGNAQSGYIFYFNPLGIQQDIRWQSGRWNLNWDAVLYRRGRLVDGGFELEVQIPFRSLKYPAGAPADGQRWGAIVTRKIPSEGMKYAWPALVPGHPRLFAQAASITGVHPPDQGSGFELVPGLALRYERGVGPDGVAFESFDRPILDQVRPMLDVRAGITPNIGMTFTANPDFSEVESDTTPVRLNQRFAFQFQERRRFFTDGIEMFQDNLDTLYTRAVVEPLWGLKVAGREGAYTIGALQAVDRSPAATVNEYGTPGFNAEDLAGTWASDTVARVRRDLPRSGHVGVTVVDRRLFGAGFQPGPTSAHDAAALDLSALFGDRWSISGANMQSLTGDAEDRRWGQRTVVDLQRASGQGTGFQLRVDDRTRDFRQELGYLPQAGITTANVLVDHTIVPKQGGFTTVTPWASGQWTSQRNGEGYQSIAVGTDALYRGIHDFSLRMSMDRRQEGEVQQVPVSGWELAASWAGQIGAAVELAPSVSVGRTMDFARLVPARTVSASLVTSLRPLTNLRVDLTGRYVHFAPVGAAPQDDGLVRMRAWLQLTRTIGLRSVEELATTSGRAPQIRHSLLAVWQLHPFTAAYLGYDETSLLDPYEVQARSVFAKVYVWWRP